jgi:hypothetical protein
MLLATIICIVVPNNYAMPLNSTDDAKSLAGMLFAKVEKFRTNLLSGVTGKVCTYADSLHTLTWEVHSRQLGASL